MALEIFRRMGFKGVHPNAMGPAHPEEATGEKYVSASVVTVGELFSDGFRFRLPWFQRAYAWREENVKRLLADIVAAQSAPRRRYFLGPIRIANGGDPGDISLIDGQQRLVTLTIIFALLRDLAHEPNTRERADKAIRVDARGQSSGSKRPYRMVMQPLLQQFFETHVQAEGGTLTDVVGVEDLLAESEQYVLENRDHLRSQILDRLPGESLRRELLEFILQSCHILVVGVDDEEEAWSMLAIEEETGLSFHSVERTKLSLIAVMPREQQEEASRIWERCQAIVGADALRLLLGHVRTIRLRRRSAKPVEKDLAQSFELNKNGTAFLRDELLVRSEQLASVRVGAIGPIEDRHAVGYRLKTLGWLEYKFWVPPLLHWLGQRGSNDSRTLSFVERVERLAWMLRLAGSDPIEQERRFIDLVGDVDRVGVPDEMKSLQIDSKMLKSALKNLRSRTFYAKHYCGHVLRLLSLRLGNDPGVVNRTSLTIEHILPRNPSNCPAWKQSFPNLAAVADYSNRLGNLVLLTPEQNQSLGNADYELKRTAFAASGQVLAGLVARDYSRWTKPDIDQRTEGLINILFEDWQLQLA